MPSDVAVIIVNYGTAEMAIAAANSVLERGADDLSVEIHVVDNASPGNDREVLNQAAAQWGDAVTLHLEQENHGFGRGNNLVLRALAARADPPEKVYLLNPDARLVTNTIAELSAFLDAHPNAAVVGSGIIHEATGEAVTCAFRFPGAISEFTGAVHFGPLSRLFSRWRVPFPPDIPTRQVDWVAGASMMARLSALKEVSFFDPDYFLYYEEVDLMHRLKRKGYEIWHLPASQVVHVGGAATGVSSENPERPALPAYWYDSWRFYFEKLHGRGGARVVALARLTGTVAGDLLCLLRRRPSRNPRNFATDFRRHVVRPLFGLGAPEGSA
jgi:N-acetylglucosaminyl-diphospho-decaprenol L-rhamnosyltransferase